MVLRKPIRGREIIGKKEMRKFFFFFSFSKCDMLGMQIERLVISEIFFPIISKVQKLCTEICV